MDITGGLLSFIQLFIDAISTNNYSGIYGNYVKLILAIITMFFDSIFIIQHFILYRKPCYELLQTDKTNLVDSQ